MKSMLLLLACVLAQPSAEAPVTVTTTIFGYGSGASVQRSVRDVANEENEEPTIEPDIAQAASDDEGAVGSDGTDDSEQMAMDTAVVQGTMEPDVAQAGGGEGTASGNGNNGNGGTAETGGGQVGGGDGDAKEDGDNSNGGTAEPGGGDGAANGNGDNSNGGTAEPGGGQVGGGDGDAKEDGDNGNGGTAEPGGGDGAANGNGDNGNGGTAEPGGGEGTASGNGNNGNGGTAEPGSGQAGAGPVGGDTTDIPVIPGVGCTTHLIDSDNLMADSTDGPAQGIANDYTDVNGVIVITLPGPCANRTTTVARGATSEAKTTTKMVTATTKQPLASATSARMTTTTEHPIVSATSTSHTVLSPITTTTLPSLAVGNAECMNGFRILQQRAVIGSHLGTSDGYFSYMSSCADLCFRNFGLTPCVGFSYDESSKCILYQYAIDYIETAAGSITINYVRC